MGIFWGVAKISNIFFGCLIFLIYFWGEQWLLFAVFHLDLRCLPKYLFSGIQNEMG